MARNVNVGDDQCKIVFWVPWGWREYWAMGEVALNLVLILLTLVLAIVGAIVGAWLQRRQWAQQNWEGVREKRTSFAMGTVEEIARLSDHRRYRELRLLWALRRCAADEIASAQKEYLVALFNWMDNFGRIKAELWHSFDRSVVNRFESDIHDKFASIGRRIEAKLRGIERGSLAREELELNELGMTTYAFVDQLLQRITREDLQGLTGRHVVSFENWDNLSVSFLIKRLFGIAT
jgi:hypothetical protein